MVVSTGLTPPKDNQVLEHGTTNIEVNSMGQKIRMLPRTVSLFLLHVIHSDIHIIQSLKLAARALSSLKYTTMG
jgi:hypothetical protein